MSRLTRDELRGILDDRLDNAEGEDAKRILIGQIIGDAFPAGDADEFERRYAERSNMTVERLRELGLIVVRCDCDYELCEGWGYVHIENAINDAEVEMKYDFAARARRGETRDA